MLDDIESQMHQKMREEFDKNAREKAMNCFGDFGKCISSKELNREFLRDNCIFCQFVQSCLFTAQLVINTKLLYKHEGGEEWKM
jgi:hypothetical protein